MWMYSSEYDVVSPYDGWLPDDDGDGARLSTPPPPPPQPQPYGTGGAFGPRSAYVRPRRPLLGSRRGACVCVHPSRPGRGDPRRGKPTAGGRGRYRSTERGPVTVCRHNLGGRPGHGVRALSNRQSHARAPRARTAGVRSGARARAAPSVWPSIRYTTLRQAWPGTRGSPRPQCAFDWSMFV